MECAAFHVPEAGDEIAEGGLAEAGGADDGVARGGDGFANENQLRSKAFLISWPNYNKNERPGRCDS